MSKQTSLRRAFALSFLVAAGIVSSFPALADDYTELHGNSAMQAKILALRGMADSYREHWNPATINDCKGVAIGAPNSDPYGSQQRQPLPKNALIRPGLGGSETIVTGAITNVCNGN